MKKLYIYIFGFLAALTIGASSFAVNLRDYALPNNALRQDLGRIFAGSASIGNLTRNPNYQDLQSWHWHVGSFTASDSKEWVIKAPKHAAGVIIQNPAMPAMAVIHGARQNLSRMEVADEADRIIQAYGLNKLRTVRRWVYPLSGDDNDLDRDDLTDMDVLIVEEKVQPADTAQVNLNGLATMPTGPANILFSDPTDYEQLGTLAKKGRIHDLHWGNVMQDTDGNWVLIDLEDLSSAQKEEIEQAHLLSRPIKRWKMRCQDEAAASIGAAQTGIAGMLAMQNQREVTGVNYAHIQENHQKAARLYQNMYWCLLIKRQAFEIAGIVTSIQAVKKVRTYFANNRVINRFVAKQRDALDGLEGAEVTDAHCLEIAQMIACEELPNEKRPEVIQAFATILRAETLADKSGSIVIFSKKYTSSNAALKESRWYLTKTFIADNIFLCRVARQVKSLWAKLPGFSFQSSQASVKPVIA